MKKMLVTIMAVVSLTFFSAPAAAGFLDKINAAAQSLKNASQNMPPVGAKIPKTEAGDRPMHLEDHYRGSCEGKRSATCMDYQELVDQCMAPLKGKRMQITGELIEKKLKTDKTLTAQQRMNLEEDLIGIREAAEAGSDDPTIAGQQRSQRYLQDISEEDQVYINAEYNTFYKKIYNKCIGADHMGIGKRTEMMQDVETMSAEEAVAQHRKQKARESAPFDCLKGLSSLRMVVMAEMMEEKMKKVNPSGKEREAWEADIASVKKAVETGSPMPAVVDPANPMRYMMRLSSEEQVAMMQEYAARNAVESEKCTKMASAPQARAPKNGGLVDHSQSPANKNAKKQKTKEYTQEELNYGRGGSTNLLGLRRDKGCADKLKGNIPRLTAELLEKKLKSASGLSAQKRKEWEEDISAFRAAAAAGVDAPEPPDPDNPYRWYDYVTNQERAAINKQHADFAAQVMKDCNNRPIKELD